MDLGIVNNVHVIIDEASLTVTNVCFAQIYACHHIVVWLFDQSEENIGTS